MNRREVLKLFLASQIPLGGLLERLGGSAECKVDGWTVRFNKRIDRGCIQGYAVKEIRGKKYHFACLFDRDDTMGSIKERFMIQVKRIDRRVA